MKPQNIWKYYRFKNFRYDDLHRLVTDSLTGSFNYQNTYYANNGNITNRSDIGDYNYNGVDAGPHAVTDLTNTTYPTPYNPHNPHPTP